MRAFIFTIAFFIGGSVTSIAQRTDTAFQKEWLAIDTLISKNDLTRTALDKVNVVYQKAKQRQLPAQMTKSLIYRYTLQDEITSNDPNHIVKSIQAEIEQSKDDIQRSILYSLLAKQYRSYYNDHRWDLLNRKNTTKQNKEDFATWSIDDFITTINRYYLLSLKNKTALQQQKIEKYDAVVINGNNRALRPTLFDLLANEALDYFKSADAYSTKPVQIFTITDPGALASIDIFIKSAFPTKDSSSSQWLALHVFQQLLSAHRNDADKNALLTADLERIEWVNRQANFSNKETAYLQVLENITAQYGSVAATSQAWFLLANIYSTKAAGYQPFGDTTNRYAYKKAKELAEKALLLFKENNQGVINIKNLLSVISAKELHLQTEMVNLPEKPFRSLVTYRNVDTLFARLIRVDYYENARDALDKEFWRSMTTRRIYKTFIQKLPFTNNDHQAHSAEIKIDALEMGRYALLTSSGAGFNDTLDKMGIQFFTVSNISYVQNKTDFFVLRRDNGKPIPNAVINIIKSTYDGKQGKWIDEKIEERTSDRNGYFTYSMPGRVYNISLQIAKGGDVLDLRQREQLYSNYNAGISDEDTYEKNRKLFFYSDRGIYRPGQTVFFKSIAVTTDAKTKLSKLYTGKNPVRVYLRDANGKKYDSLNATLNEFGSINGKFQLPQNVLTGRFSIMTERFQQVVAEFNVEEYKRPTFNVTFDKAKGAYRLNDSVTVIGNVNAFAGNHIDGANVVYSVRRNTRFTDRWSYSRPYPAGSNREISHGEIKTDAQGRFTITFKASVDDIIDKSGKPLFDFSVSADVTDINGETRSSSTTITVGYSSLLLQITAPELTDADSLKKIRISSTNLSYEKEAAVVHVKIYSLVAPEHAVRKRYWQRPDQFVMSKNEFTNTFPNDEYEEESNISTWATGSLVTEATVDTKEKDSFAITEGLLTTGHYRIEAIAVDKYGEETKEIKYIALFSAKKKQAASPSYQFNYTINGTAKPGETASFTRSSVADELFVIRKTDRPRRKNEDYKFTDKSDKFETITYKPDESDRGGVTVSEVYVYDNRVYTHTYSIDVPWNNKELAVKYATYRDKTEPGSKETWTVTVQNDRNENVPAELMTAMYDASLDQFRPIDWSEPTIWETHRSETFFIGTTNFNSQQSRENYLPEKYIEQIALAYDHLAMDAYELIDKNLTKWLNDSTLYIPVSMRMSRQSLHEVVTVGYGTSKRANKEGTIQIRGMATNQNKLDYARIGSVNRAGMREEAAVPAPEMSPKQEPEIGSDDSPIITRKNFNETAFFFPQLYADSSGKYSFTFTMPDALTQWKWMSLAHTKDLAFGTYSANIITQKKLMIQANAPRFMREGDNMEFSTKIINMSDKEITGQATLELVDPLTNNSVDGWFQNVFPSQFFTVEAGQSFAVKFPIQIPFGYNRPLTWRVKARAGEFSDGEENTLPILTNRMLVTETLPLYLANDSTQHFTFDKLLKTTSESLTHQGLTVEYTSNPVWYAVQALPYLMEYPYECAEQTFNRFYANALASYIVNKNPRIKQVFEQWKKDSSSLKSNLQKNEELKQVLLQETPWVMQAESEEQQKKNIALLFDLAKIGAQTDASIAKLSQMQLSNGSFPWFKGGGEDRYITNYILTGIGKLKRLGALPPEAASGIRIMLVNALKYMDGKIAEDYNWLIKNKADLNTQHISSFQIEYLYMRSFFRDIAQQSQKEYDYYFKQGKQFWVKQNSYYKAQLGLIYYRNNDEKFATGTVLPALLENAVIDPKQGTYWKTAYTGYWYQSPIEHQSMMIAFISEINTDQKNASIAKNIDAMKTWLLLNKQTNNWRTTIATADACYALLLNGSDWLNADKKVTIRLGNTVINSSNEKTETATGYFKKRIDGEKVKPEMGNVTVTVDSKIVSSSPSWGSIYWQYFEDMDKITPAISPLSLTKKLFVERNTDKGKLLEPVKENEELKTGDKIIVRIELRSDRDMDYLHLKDMRAASMEPVNVLSGYKWQDGLGYYESTKDASTNFFIDHLRKGTYVFDYPLFITHTGIFSAGIATIQCMYAPEFTSHSEGIKIRVAR